MPLLVRESTKEYPIRGSNLVLEKGTLILFSVSGLHSDERYYPNPEKFIPERFNEENSAGKTFVDRPYLPFGDGPRNCIGMRLGKMQTKVGLALMLQKYKYELGDQHIGKELDINPAVFISAPSTGIELKISPRK